MYRVRDETGTALVGAGAMTDGGGVLASVSVREQILRICELLMKAGAVHEVRIPKTDKQGTISRYFDSAEALAHAALQYDGKVPGVYIALNPCNPALLARAANRLQSRAALTTSDPDILCRRWLLIDCDPKRLAGISSTDHEHGQAISIACGVWDELRTAGFPDPVVANSGNGTHLLYRVDLPNNAESIELIKRLLRGVQERCGTGDIAIDGTVFNAARITKLYGWFVMKGDNLPDRPHRRSGLLEIPETMDVLEVQ